MNTTSFYVSKFADMWGSPFNNWNRHFKRDFIKAFLITIFLVSFVLFPMRALHSFFPQEVPTAAPEKTIDPKELEILMNSLNVAGPACVNPIPLRCESPIKNWIDDPFSEAWGKTREKGG